MLKTVRFIPNKQLLVHGIGHHGVDKMEPRMSELQDMADEVLRLDCLHSDTEASQPAWLHPTMALWPSDPLMFVMPDGVVCCVCAAVTGRG